ncbi:Protein NDRG3 [Nymphon striatum]|nr:Protein NDRG3 [Nymphon striatum]
MPSGHMDDIELKDIDLQMPTVRSLSKSASIESQQDERVDTDFGFIQVSVQGNRSKPAIVTYHDIGLNSKCLFKLLQNAVLYFMFQIFYNLLKVENMISGILNHSLSKTFSSSIRSQLRNFLPIYCINRLTPQMLNDVEVWKYICQSSVSCFQAFFNFEDTRILMQNFCIYNINAPGQEEGAANLDSG